MLGKLLKHEWKSTYKICGAFLLFILIMTLLGYISFQAPMWKNVIEENNYSISALDVMGMAGVLFYVISIIGVVCGTYLFLGIHFFRTMYSQEGYLTHTLPVTTHKLFLSKILVSGLWYLIVNIVMLLSVFTLIYSFADRIFQSTAGGSISLWAFCMQNKSKISEILQQLLGIKLSIFTMHSIVSFFISSFVNIIYLFGAMTLGQLSSKHKILFSIVSYFGIIIGIQIVVGLITMPYAMISSYQFMNNEIERIDVMPTYFINLGSSIVISAILYFISYFIMKKKLNLE